MSRSAVTFAALILLSGAGLVGASERTLEMEPESTDVAFSLEATGENVLGHLYLRSGEIHFDPETGAASGLIEIDALKAETGNKKRDKKMHKAVLESASHPLITFEPTRFEGELKSEGPSEVTLIGVVTLLGAGHPLSIAATVHPAGQRMSFEASFEVPYVAWGLHDPSWFVMKVAKEVYVTIEAEGALVADTDALAAAGKR
jgi:polyisoprenoid-binding protein YceI